MLHFRDEKENVNFSFQPKTSKNFTTNTASVAATIDAGLRTRILESEVESMTTPAIIGWYCFASIFVGSFVVCFLYFYCHNQRSHRRAQQALDDQRRLEMIEANVARWSKVENDRITRLVKACLQKYTKVRDSTSMVCLLLFFGMFRCILIVGTLLMKPNNAKCVWIYDKNSLLHRLSFAKKLFVPNGTNQ